MEDITKIPTEKLEEDLRDSNNDISICACALSQGVVNYSGGPVMDRLNSNKHFVEVISKELKRRGVYVV